MSRYVVGSSSSMTGGVLCEQHRDPHPLALGAGQLLHGPPRQLRHPRRGHRLLHRSRFRSPDRRDDRAGARHRPTGPHLARFAAAGLPQPERTTIGWGYPLYATPIG